LKYKIAAISLLVALTGWIVPAKTVSQTKPLVFNSQNKKVELQKESVIYKTDGPINENSDTRALGMVKSVPTTKTQKTGHKVDGKNVSARFDYPSPTADKEAVKTLIIGYSKQYGIDPTVPLCIAYHESGYNASSKNKTSSASGVFQYLPSTWQGTDEAKSGASVLDADSNVKAAVKYMASRKSTQPWQVKNKCPRL
jgi:hypothetical protein